MVALLDFLDLLATDMIPWSYPPPPMNPPNKLLLELSAHLLDFLNRSFPGLVGISAFIGPPLVLSPVGRVCIVGTFLGPPFVRPMVGCVFVRISTDG